MATKARFKRGEILFYRDEYEVFKYKVLDVFNSKQRYRIKEIDPNRNPYTIQPEMISFNQAHKFFMKKQMYRTLYA